MGFAILQRISTTGRKIILVVVESALKPYEDDASGSIPEKNGSILNET